MEKQSKAWKKLWIVRAGLKLWVYFFSVAYFFPNYFICFSLFLLDSNFVVSQLSLFNVVIKKVLNGVLEELPPPVLLGPAQSWKLQ